eukprot:6184810-Pleurochrysis_carterae.AAC.1
MQPPNPHPARASSQEKSPASSQRLRGHACGSARRAPVRLRCGGARTRWAACPRARWNGAGSAAACAAEWTRRRSTAISTAQPDEIDITRTVSTAEQRNRNKMRCIVRFERSCGKSCVETFTSSSRDPALIAEVKSAMWTCGLEHASLSAMLAGTNKSDH